MYTLCVVARYRGWCKFEPVSSDWSPARDPVVLQQLLKWLGVDVTEAHFQVLTGTGAVRGGGSMDPTTTESDGCAYGGGFAAAEAQSQRGAECEESPSNPGQNPVNS